MERLRNALRDLAQRSAVPFGVAALVIAGLLGMHAVSGMPATAAMPPASAPAAVAEASTDAPLHHSAHGCHGCTGDGDIAGAMAVCGMVLLAAIALGVASSPGIVRFAGPALLRRARGVLRSLGEPRPSLLQLSISRR